MDNGLSTCKVSFPSFASSYYKSALWVSCFLKKICQEVDFAQVSLNMESRGKSTLLTAYHIWALLCRPSPTMYSVLTRHYSLKKITFRYRHFYTKNITVSVRLQQNISFYEKYFIIVQGPVSLMTGYVI